MRFLPLTFLLALIGCKDTGDSAKEDTGTVDDTDTGDTETGDTDTGDTDTGDTDTGDTDTGDTDTGETGDTDTSAECWTAWEAGTCWACDLPTTAEDDSDKFLNQCSDTTYAVFDNSARIPSSTWVEGDPLPPVE